MISIVHRRSLAAAACAALLAAMVGPVGRAQAAPAPAGLPADLAPQIVKAGDDEGWVVGRSSGTPSDHVQVWRLRLDGGAAAVATLPKLTSPDAIGFAGGLAVAGLRCVDAGCGTARAEVVLIDDRGAVSKPVTLWEQGAIDDGDGLRIAGSTGLGVIVSGRGRLYEIAADGTVSRTVAGTDGGACVLDGDVYALVNSAAEEARGAAPRTISVGPDQGTARITVEVQRLGSSWTAVAGSRQVFEAPGYPPTTRCTARGIEVDAGVDSLLGRWTPATGWQSAAVRPRPAGTMSGDRSSSGVYARAAGGGIARRTASGGFESTQLTLPADSRHLSVDESARVIVGCAASVCRVAAAGPGAPVSIVDALMPAPGRSINAPTAVQHHYNICGSSCSDDQAEYSLAIAQFFFVVDSGWSLSLNEACGTDFLDLARRLNANGTFVVAKRVADGCPNAADQAFGNAVIHRGDKQDGKAAYLFNPGKVCGAGQPDSTECRVMLCVKVSFSGTLTGPCTAHLAAASQLSVADRQRQAREYIFIAMAFNEPARGVSLAGDFNLRPNEVPPVFPDLLHDGVLGNTWNAHGTPDRKIDYIWQERFAVNFGYAAYCDAGDLASDHCWTHAAWLF